MFLHLLSLFIRYIRLNINKFYNKHQYHFYFKLPSTLFVIFPFFVYLPGQYFHIYPQILFKIKRSEKNLCILFSHRFIHIRAATVYYLLAEVWVTWRERRCVRVSVGTTAAEAAVCAGTHTGVCEIERVVYTRRTQETVVLFA